MAEHLILSLEEEEDREAERLWIEEADADIRNINRAKFKQYQQIRGSRMPVQGLNDKSCISACLPFIVLTNE